MDKKARSKQMGSLIERLLQYDIFDVVVFGDKVILDEDIRKWPWCDFMISFYSEGFPLRKAIEYQKRRGVFSVNNLPMQELLWDRRLVLQVLDHVNVHTPPRWTVTRDGGPHVSDDTRILLQNRLGLTVPRVYPMSKVVQLDYDTILINGETVRKPFVEKPVSGEDHNIYIYFSQEQGGGTRKLFRKVGNKSSEYFPDLWQIRSTGSYIYEQFMDVDNAEDVKVYTIGSNFCHAETRKSPVVDGIVQRNAEGKEVRYTAELTPEERDSAYRVSKAFGQFVCGIDFLRVEGTSYVIDVNGWSFVKGYKNYYDVCSAKLHDLFIQAAERRWFAMHYWKKPANENQWVLKGFLSVFRHADRTPKQKIKYGFTSAPFVELLQGSRQEVILRKTPDLARVVATAKVALEQNLEDVDKLEQLTTILQRKMHMEGTKVQLKPAFNKTTGDLLKIQVILKWGGGCTHAGIHHTQDLADDMRKDLSVLNKKLLDEVVVYSSSEQRVLDTAKVFCERFLRMTTIPDDFLIIRKDMLDDSNAAKEQMDAVKSRLKAFFKAHEADLAISQGFALPEEMQDPQTFVRGVYDLLARVTRHMRRNLDSSYIENTILKDYHWCCNENVALFRERWEKLLQDFGKVEKNKFDPGKVGELYDSLKYDALHNRPLMDRIFISPDQQGSIGTSPESTHSGLGLRNVDPNGFSAGSHILRNGDSIGVRRVSEGLAALALSQRSGRPNESGSIGTCGSLGTLGDSSPTITTTLVPSVPVLVATPLSTRSIDKPSPISIVTPGHSTGHPPSGLCLTSVSTSPSSIPSETYDHSLGKSPPVASSMGRRTSWSSRGRLSPFPYNRTSIHKIGQDIRTPEPIRELYHKAKLLFDFVTPREYGITDQEKLDIGVLTSVPLLKRIIADINQLIQQDNPGCRLYFTKESHIHTLLNCVFMSGLPMKLSAHQVVELDFLTQITFEVYERRRDHLGLEPEYSLRLGLSPGAYYSNVIDHQVDANHALAAAPRKDLTDHIELNKALGYFQSMLDATTKDHQNPNGPL
ncbi:inositol hexakisphosphate and diphosphoinositol-pentakisphosphate kinase [Dispira simplex]|nr:inositol hexakisphosphate and diphosphoinositol-pentakisphosphate kinase [Dispira simplex]